MPLAAAGWVDLGLGIPSGRLPEDAACGDAIDWLVREMDRFGVAQGMLELDPLALEASQRHPDRFFLAYEADANRGMDEVRRIHALRARHGIRAVSARPASLCPQVPIDDRRWYPIYAACVELDLPFVCSVGVPRARVPFAAQKLERVDEVCWFFPELRLVMRDGGEPWTELAVLLLAKWPNLFLMTNGRAPAEYPAAWLELANGPGADKLLFAGGFPEAPLEVCAKQVRELPLLPHVWPKFLRENALRVFKLPS